MNRFSGWSMKLMPACLALSIVVGIAGCGGGDSDSESGGDSSGLQGKISIDGSSTVYPISEAIASDFKKTYGEVDVQVAFSGTGNGFKKFNKGETDISDASRPIKSGEFDACAENHVHFIEIPVAYDGLTIAVNPKNEFVEQLSVEDLRNIFLDGRAQTWKDVNDAWPDEPLEIYAPDTGSGTFDYFIEVVIEDEETESFRTDINASEDDNILVEGIANNEFAIGFFGVAYYRENTDKLRALPIVNPDSGEAVSPDADKIESGEYAPFSRPLFIYVSKESAERVEVKTFVEYYLENAAETAAAQGYVALPESVYTSAMKHFKEELTGTHYLDADGNKQTGSVVDLYSEDNLHDFE